MEKKKMALRNIEEDIGRALSHFMSAFCPLVSDCVLFPMSTFFPLGLCSNLLTYRPYFSVPNLLTYRPYFTTPHLCVPKLADLPTLLYLPPTLVFPNLPTCRPYISVPKLADPTLVSPYLH